MKQHATSLLLHPGFLIGLAVLILNDTWLKSAFPGLITGKLSDFAGLLIFPMFWTVCFPRFKRAVYVFTGLAFLIWKTPLASEFITSFNSWSPLPIDRTVDYSDWLALMVLPLSYRIQPRVISRKKGCHLLQPAFSLLVAGVSLFAFCATSVPPRYRQFTSDDGEGSLKMYREYELRMTEAEIVQKLDELGYDWRTDSIARPPWSSTPLHYLSVFRLGYQGDTLERVWLSITQVDEKTSLLTARGATLPEGSETYMWKQYLKLLDEYGDLVQKGLVKPLKKKRNR